MNQWRYEIAKVERFILGDGGMILPVIGTGLSPRGVRCGKPSSQFPRPKTQFNGRFAHIYRGISHWKCSDIAELARRDRSVAASRRAAPKSMLIPLKSFAPGLA